MAAVGCHWWGCDVATLHVSVDWPRLAVLWGLYDTAVRVLWRHGARREGVRRVVVTAALVILVHHPGLAAPTTPLHSRGALEHG